MTGPDNFLSRWSRRKQEAARQEASPDGESEAAAKTGEQTESERRPGSPEQAETIFDLSKLPSLDSIGPNTDLSAFMQRGVPTSLSHAALRRAWAADPAIRDFIGLSENSWDFTAPDSIPGFGPLLPADEVKQLVAKVFNSSTADPAESAPDTLSAPDTFASIETPANDRDDQTPQAQQAGAAPGGAVTGDCEESSNTRAPAAEILQRDRSNAAPQEIIDADASEALPRRRHGGALPT